MGSPHLLTTVQRPSRYGMLQYQKHGAGKASARGAHDRRSSAGLEVGGGERLWHAPEGRPPVAAVDHQACGFYRAALPPAMATRASRHPVRHNGKRMHAHPFWIISTWGHAPKECSTFGELSPHNLTNISCQPFLYKFKTQRI